MSRNAFNPFADPSVTRHTADEGDGGYDVPAATVGGAWGVGGGGAWAADPPHAGGAASPKSPKMPENGSTPQDTKGRSAPARSRQDNQESLPPTVPQGRVAASTAKNFPSCYPIVYHDIDAEIPEHMRFLVRMALYSYLLFVSALVVNFLAVLLSIGSDDFDIIGVFFAAVYLIVGPPAAWVLWYRRIYNAAAKDRAITYMCFFLLYAVHIGFCAWAALVLHITKSTIESVQRFLIPRRNLIVLPSCALLGYSTFPPPVGFDDGTSFAGIFTMASQFSDSVWRGVIFLIGLLFWGACTLMGVWVWSQMMRAFRNQGGVQQAKSEAKGAVGRAAISQAGRV